MGEGRKENVPDEINFEKDSEREIPDEQVALPKEIAVENAKEEELSPEIIKKIMEKVQDIDNKGVAYTSVGDFGFNKAYRSFGHALFEAEKSRNYKMVEGLARTKNDFIKSRKQELDSKFTVHLGDILKFGIQGGVKMEEREIGATTGKQWSQLLKDLRTDKRVHFNIVGRSIPDHSGSKTEIGNAYFSNIYNQEDGQEDLTIIFDISDFEETNPTSNYTTKGVTPRKYHSNDSSILNTFNFYKENAFPLKPDLKVGDPLLKEHGKNHKHEIGVHRHFDEEGKPMPDTEHGFVLTPRIPSWRFRGLVLGGSDEDVNKRVLEMTKMMKGTYGNKTEKLLPIYNQNGDLLWPKQMSYEEVQSFVKERDKNKQEDKE